jgi:adenine deaminase
MTAKLERLIEVARGECPADLLLTGGKVINTLSGEILEQDVAIFDDRIAGVGEGYQARETVDLEGSNLSPVSSTGISISRVPWSRARDCPRAVTPQGTTTVIADPHEIANDLGYDAFASCWFQQVQTLNVYFMFLPAYPHRYGDRGSELRGADLLPFLKEKWVLGLGEMMNYPGVLNRDREVLDKLKVASEKRLDGHAPGLTGKDLCAYIAAGIHSAHECTTAERL